MSGHSRLRQGLLAVLVAVLGVGVLLLVRGRNASPIPLEHSIPASAQTEARATQPGLDGGAMAGEPTPARHLTGSVSFPKNTPPDERVEVVLEHVPLKADGQRDLVREFEGRWEQAARVSVASDGGARRVPVDGLTDRGRSILRTSRQEPLLLKPAVTPAAARELVSPTESALSF